MFFIYNPFFFLFFFFFNKNNNSPTHNLPETVCRRSIKAPVTQIDVRRFGKFKGLPNYSKVGKQAHMKHLFGGVWNLPGGLGCIKTSILTMLPSSPPVRRPSRSFTTFACSPVHLWNSLSNTNKLCSPVLQDSLLLSLVTKGAGKRLGSPPSCTAGSPTYSISQNLLGFFSRSCLTWLRRRCLRKYGEESQVWVLGSK